MPDTNVLDVKNLSVSYSTPRGDLKALRNVSMAIGQKKIVGIVGESGCGKSTLISAIIRLMANNATVHSGEILFHNSNLLDFKEREMRALRGIDISMVFQDPMQTHNPVLTIGQQMIDIQYRDKLSKSKKRQRAAEMLSLVGIPDAQARLNQYPYEFSGGMRQRIAIAMALMAKPDLLIADEPTTALDATLEVQIIKRLEELQEEIGCSILFISHHLGVIAELCDEVVVMYAGEVVEQGSVRDVFHSPAHPYTAALLKCDPGHIKEKTRNLPTIPGEIPDLVDVPAGCIFQDRCSRKVPQCQVKRPLFEAVNEQHSVACHLNNKNADDSDHKEARG
ncbi:peptide ABC transporter ATP-binding protein [Kiloniella spongiae]|uniref:Peptide ABC transporter ATP-binding protein n=1 Tax=Kiloniella spongiae TaxID=1489064 RepID=A0A0H2MHE3_9PROT|nr:ABC transporter ATP-binding protein [Kiloniella spongiae]KLN61601.1 peptide ABC transporter ATP-binding protein [Kiloniella spongiae]